MNEDTNTPRWPMPFVRLELVVLQPGADALEVLLVKRAEAPHKGRWALPGGVLRTDLDDSPDAAAARVAKERLGLGLPALAQVVAVGGPQRDPRAPWALSLVYRCLVPNGAIAPVEGKRVEAIAWRSAVEASGDNLLAFDHAALVARTLELTRRETRAFTLPFGLLPAAFTLAELQQACERVLGSSLDKSSFRRRLADREVVQPLEGESRTAGGRPAQLYQHLPEPG